MVLPAVLRHPARDPEQASRRDGARRLDRHPGLPAVARYLESALGALPAALPAVLLGVRHRLHRARLSRLEAAGRQLRALRAHLHRLLLRLFPRDPAAAGQGRDDQAAAEFDRGTRCCWKASRSGRPLRLHRSPRLEATPWSLRALSLSPLRSPRWPRPRGRKSTTRPNAADEQVVVRGTVRQIRSRAAPARTSRSIAKSARSVTA